MNQPATFDYLGALLANVGPGTTPASPDAMTADDLRAWLDMHGVAAGDMMDSCLVMFAGRSEDEMDAFNAALHD